MFFFINSTIFWNGGKWLYDTALKAKQNKQTKIPVKLATLVHRNLFYLRGDNFLKTLDNKIKIQLIIVEWFSYFLSKLKHNELVEFLYVIENVYL